jgi:hypothetical protein
MTVSFRTENRGPGAIREGHVTVHVQDMADRRTHHSIRFLMGLGLDSDGHRRITKGEDYLLLGGSERTHDRMQGDVEQFRETLDKMGTDLQRASQEEMREAARESGLLDEDGRPRRRNS